MTSRRLEDRCIPAPGSRSRQSGAEESLENGTSRTGANGGGGCPVGSATGFLEQCPAAPDVGAAMEAVFRRIQPKTEGGPKERLGDDGMMDTFSDDPVMSPGEREYSGFPDAVSR